MLNKECVIIIVSFLLIAAISMPALAENTVKISSEIKADIENYNSTRVIFELKNNETTTNL